MQIERNGRPRAVVTGVGALTSLGAVESYWQDLKAGKSGIRKISLFDPGNLEVHIASEVAFDPSEHIDGKTARRMSRASMLALVPG
jgi:3-oxoacyl-[acyl-carrier-protein] synthase II